MHTVRCLLSIPEHLTRNQSTDYQRLIRVIAASRCSIQTLA